MLRTRPCKVNAPAATPQQRGRGVFPGQMRWAATVGNRGNLDQDRRATFRAEVEMPVETNLPSVLLSSLGILP